MFPAMDAILLLSLAMAAPLAAKEILVLRERLDLEAPKDIKGPQEQGELKEQQGKQE